MSTHGSTAGTSAYEWWEKYILPRDVQPRARAISARLRRGNKAAVMMEPAVHDLYQRLRAFSVSPDRVLSLAVILANVRSYVSLPLARRLGPSKYDANDAALSALRFEKLIRAEGDELTTCIRRAIGMAGESCNVSRLAEDIIFWGDAVRTRWCFDYFDADASTADLVSSPSREQ